MSLVEGCVGGCFLGGGGRCVCWGGDGGGLPGQEEREKGIVCEEKGRHDVLYGCVQAGVHGWDAADQTASCEPHVVGLGSVDLLVRYMARCVVPRSAVMMCSSLSQPAGQL